MEDFHWCHFVSLTSTRQDILRWEHLFAYLPKEHLNQRLTQGMNI